MSAFDPNAFLATTTTEANSTRFPALPEGEYRSLIDDVKAETAGKNNAPMLRVTHEIIGMADGNSIDALKAEMGLQKITVRQDIWLDLNDAGHLATGEGRNVKLGKLREALGQNKPGQPWGPAMLKGAGPVIISVSRRVDPNDSDTVYNDVKKVVAA